MIVSLAAKGDRDAFTELLRRRQSWLRNFMRRCCGDEVLADDLSQQLFLQVWRKIRQLREPEKFGSWLQRMAVNLWLQHQRKNDPLWNAEDEANVPPSQQDLAVAMDLDKALAMLPGRERLCVILSYHERLSHGEIVALVDMQPGTVKSHIHRGSRRLQELLSAYGASA
ncbi:MAG: RNA polymerase sigma factor [Planctomycetota bacterium]|nr:RNA polymerase sigma factor [Planctomycetota bacterium]